MENIPEVSVVLPCLNEEAAVSVCINKIKDVFSKEAINGEIIVVDNASTDRSRQIAEELGARVAIETIRGYGSAYLKGLSEAKGKFIIIADLDDSYDFYDIPKFLKLLRDGHDFVIGSRFKGKISKRAMSWSHRYVGNPILSGVCRLFFHTRISDVHCGMRAFSIEAYKKMKLNSTGMEFATEMVVSALQNNLKICEVPINYNARIGKSKLSSFRDAWRHVRFMLLFCPDWLYFIPGAIGFLAGLIILFLQLQGPFLFLGHKWDIHVMVLGSLTSLLSFQIINLGIYAKVFAVRERFVKNDKFISYLLKKFKLEFGLVAGAIFLILGFTVNLLVFLEWWRSSFGPLHRIRETIFAMTFMVLGIEIIFSSFFLSLLMINRNSCSGKNNN